MHLYERAATPTWLHGRHDQSSGSRSSIHQRPQPIGKLEALQIILRDFERLCLLLGRLRHCRTRVDRSRSHFSRFLVHGFGIHPLPVIWNRRPDLFRCGIAYASLFWSGEARRKIARKRRESGLPFPVKRTMITDGTTRGASRAPAHERNA
jgi:hypothetical protein